MGYHTGIVRHCVMYVYIGPATSCFCRCMGKVEALMLSTRLPLKHTMSCGEEGRDRAGEEDGDRVGEGEGLREKATILLRQCIYMYIHVYIIIQHYTCKCTLRW